MTITGKETGATSSFLNKLRLATAQAHKQLEELPVSLAITSPVVTISEYTNYLRLMYSIVSDVEENVYPQLSFIFPGICKRAKAHLIKEDLAYLKAKPAISDYPLTQINKHHSNAFALGIMYVIEGSTLGGRFILKNIEKHLGLDAQQGCRYFAGYQSETGSLWKAFLDEITCFADSTNEDDIIEGAVFAFQTIHNYMIKQQADLP